VRLPFDLDSLLVLIQVMLTNTTMHRNPQGQESEVNQTFDVPTYETIRSILVISNGLFHVHDSQAKHLKFYSNNYLVQTSQSTSHMSHYDW
jgi:hypothetical protein